MFNGLKEIYLPISCSNTSFIILSDFLGIPDRTYLIPDNEKDRLKRLKDYQILDSPSESAFENLTRLAADIFNMPIAIVALIDEDRQWHKSYVGIECKEIDRAFSFCNDLLVDGEVITSSDATDDPRFNDNPFVTDEHNIRSIAAAPIKTGDGYILGGFCVLDREQRDFSDNEKNILRRLATEAMSQIDLRYRNDELRQINQDLQDGLRDLEQQLDEKTIQREELIHRTKNHFNQVKSILSLQKSKLTNKDSVRALEVAETRIQAFVCIYDQLNEAKQSLMLDSNAFLGSITSNIRKVFEQDPISLSIEQNFEDVELSGDNALKFGLALNELMSNAYQHVFLPKLGSRLFLKFEDHGDERILTVQDDGPGLSSEDDKNDRFREGLNLLRDLIEHDGEGSINYRDEEGSIFTVTLPRS